MRISSSLRSISQTTSAALVLCTLGACAGSTLRIESQPEGADVSVVRPGSSPQKLGKTPLDLDKGASGDLFNDSVQILVAKEGQQPQSVLLPRLKSQSDVRVMIDLNSGALPEVCVDQIKSLQEVAAGVANAQKQISKKDFSGAQAQLRALTIKHPKVAVLYDLLGNSYYLQKDLGGALEAYRRSREVQPGNPETQRMIDKISAIRSTGQAEGGVR
jgi:hypothetical protein